MPRDSINYNVTTINKKILLQKELLRRGNVTDEHTDIPIANRPIRIDSGLEKALTAMPQMRPGGYAHISNASKTSNTRKILNYQNDERQPYLLCSPLQFAALC